MGARVEGPLRAPALGIVEAAVAVEVPRVRGRASVVASNCTGSPGAGACGLKVKAAVGSAPCAGAETSSRSASATARISFGFMDETVSKRPPPRHPAAP